MTDHLTEKKTAQSWIPLAYFEGIFEQMERAYARNGNSALYYARF